MIIFNAFIYVEFVTVFVWDSIDHYGCFSSLGIYPLEIISLSILPIIFTILSFAFTIRSLDSNILLLLSFISG